MKCRTLWFEQGIRTDSEYLRKSKQQFYTRKLTCLLYMRNGRSVSSNKFCKICLGKCCLISKTADIITNYAF